MTRRLIMGEIDFTTISGGNDPSNGSGNGTGAGGGNPFGGIPIMFGGNSSGSGNGDDIIESMLINYNEKFKDADPILFRDEVSKQAISVLISKNKPNPLLVGPAGSGKTKIVEDMARRIANGDKTIPPMLQGHTVYELPLSSLVAGASYVGDLEKNVNALIEFAEDPDNDVIIFIDEIHRLGGEDHSQYNKIAQMIKPMLARNSAKVIGATTNQEAQDLMDDPALSRRFTRVLVDELTQEQTETILENMWASMSDHYDHKVQVTDQDLFMTVVKLADRFNMPGMHRPDNAITLLDRSCADAYLAMSDQAAAGPDPAVEALLNDPNVPDDVKQTIAAAASTAFTLDEDRVAMVAKKMMSGHARKTDITREELEDAFKNLIGQDEAVERVIDAVLRRDLALFPTKKPLTALFAGPSGCGKTETARIIAQQLTGKDPIIINMTEFHSPSSINRIIGSPAGYVGSTSKQELPFDCLESNPYQVILLDELEKGDSSVQRLFMSAFDEGYIKTARGKVIDFSKAIIFATTNAGHTDGASGSIGFAETSYENQGKRDISSVSHAFDTEFLNRFQMICTFNPISKETYGQILADRYAVEVSRILAENPKMLLPETLSDELIEQFVTETYVSELGARPAMRTVQRHIEDVAMSMRGVNKAMLMAQDDGTEIAVPEQKEDF